MKIRKQVMRETWYLRHWWTIVLGVALYAGFFYELNLHFPAVQETLARLGPWAPVAFIALYLLLAPLFFPLSLLDLSCGALFGITRGFGILVVANALAALEMFVLARWLLAGRVSAWIDQRAHWARFRHLAARDEWKFLVLIRLSPTNFAIVNYLMGAARVRPSRYLLTWFILIPKSFVHVSIGNTLLRLGNSPSSGSMAGQLELVLGVAGLASLILLLALVGMRARQAIDRAASENESDGQSQP